MLSVGRQLLGSSNRCFAAAVSAFAGAPRNASRSHKFTVFRFDPEGSKAAAFDEFRVDLHKTGPMVLDALLKIKNEMDPTLAFRRSCREGICGSCAMNLDGKNGLACITPIDASKTETVIRPLPHMFILRDLVPDLTDFYKKYEEIQPWLQRADDQEAKSTETLQTIEDRRKLDGLYECILCACCTTSCPSYWWHPETFLGPQALLAANRWIKDSRDENNRVRLSALNDTMKLYRCHTIANCSDCCPKNLKPSVAIEELKRAVQESFDSDDAAVPVQRD
eukprot:Gregarina_sp_Poly_1__6768@NODE_364_length_9189_cov_605_028174_g300_i0_p5_GENE_NODE_364_length_9189_cov_605_028174_g300_i0NODE_364_length_9189_cov_605_028174_g300_i0_p5_ORF_typecomplete_len279_score37_41Fer2_3/PF13085_6/2_8e35Fer4_17/PF13534_6/1_4e04Fer4_17/PF13534_6/3_1e12Fer4_10/PF13237_6/2_4e03Fer4_10/PF13237_6/4_5e07Fer4_8/PF13183_6/0_69Fer4_8/PF13183_6/9_4e06Fer2/PF00111_27/0_00089Fer2/PF00111_27/3_4e03Fer2/PF00111_27/2_1e03Fer4_16/PF13484_6/8e03Fer4_16/PF13484_6/0_0038SNAD2/PF18745_1/3_2e03